MDVMINAGLLKIVGQARFLENYLHGNFGGQTGPVRMPDNLQSAIQTAFILQMVSVFDDGLDCVWSREGLRGQPPHLGVKVSLFADKAMFINGAEAKELVKMRNRLAHDTIAMAKQEDWHWALRVVKRELHHLRLISPAEAPTQPE